MTESEYLLVVNDKIVTSHASTALCNHAHHTHIDLLRGTIATYQQRYDISFYNHPSEVAVVDTLQFFAPTVRLADRGQPMLSEAVQARFPSATEALQSRSKEITEIQSAVVRMQVAFTGAQEETRNKSLAQIYWYPTAYAVSPTMYMASSQTDTVCLATYRSFIFPPKRQTATRGAIHMCPDVDASDSDLDWCSYKKVPVEVISEYNMAGELVETIDPVNGRAWPSGGDHADLAVLRVLDHSFRFSNYFVPSAVDDETLRTTPHDVGFIGYPQAPKFSAITQLVAKLKHLGRLPKCEEEPQDVVPDIHLSMVEESLKDAFHDHKWKILSLGSTITAINKPSTPRSMCAVAVTNSSTSCNAGSPFFLPHEPCMVLGQHLSGGVFESRSAHAEINYNLFMSVHHPEWVARYAKFALPTLPSCAPAYPFLSRHQKSLQEKGLWKE